MTELERHLLTAFERLEKSYSEQLATLQYAQKSLQTMFERTSQENSQLKAQVSSLNEQVTNLSGQVQQLARLYSTNRR
ncbi:TPA: MbeD family mobilization/exclusion protein [Proteus mirabilis]|nr:MbeD family mobilization/exclusion protein [Proteus mirabilis]MCL8603850.1 MbeD family mobilization/exclusion protein [Proteus mirabilis]HEJ9400058.1 MbeD family mobilization/exclusion protein [Proteus mirabilis]